MNADQAKSLEEYITNVNNEVKNAQSVMDRGAALGVLVWSTAGLNGQLSFLSGLYVATLKTGVKPNRTEDERAAERVLMEKVRASLNAANQLYGAMQERVSVLLEKVEG